MYIKDRNYNPLFDKILIVVDILMVTLVIVNLILLGFQMNFESESIRAIIRQYLYPLYVFYMPIYRNFLFIDAVFVTIFITELCVRWLIAIFQKTYYRWFFYPFVNWYDVLGCIPVGSFRILRVFRVIAIIIRLNRMKVIDIRTWYLYKVFMKYINILTEEVSDRVVVNVIEGVQDEIKTGVPLTDKIMNEVIIPRKDVIVNFVSHRFQKVTRDQYAAARDNLRESIKDSVIKAFHQNENIKKLEMVPVVGKVASEALQQSVYDITFQTINNIFEKLSSDESRVMIEKMTDGVIESIMLKEEDKQLQDTFTEIIVHTLEMVKEQVKVQQWKLKEIEEREAKKQAELEKRLASDFG
jgi:hypothetical protein